MLLFTFICAIGAFEIPALVELPGHVMVFTTEIYLQVKERYPPDYGEASACSVILMVFVAAGILLYSRTTSGCTA